MYEVKVTQEIPYWNGDDDEIMESTGKVKEYVAGTFRAEHLAKLFVEALEQQIADKSGYVSNAFTPEVSIWEVTEDAKRSRGRCAMSKAELLKELYVMVQKENYACRFGLGCRIDTSEDSHQRSKDIRAFLVDLFDECEGETRELLHMLEKAINENVCGE